MDQRTTLDGDIVLDRKPGYLRVWHGRSANSVEEAHQVLAAMDQALEDWDLDRMLFDSRDANDTPPEIGAMIWRWLDEHPRLRRVVTLVQDADRADRINTGMLGDQVRIRAFHKEAPAARWLTILR